ncbi:MAG: aminopeptidase [Nitrosospira sp.]|nr:aminopeptidase [Nitrosospira sp.]
MNAIISCLTARHLFRYRIALVDYVRLLKLQQGAFSANKSDRRAPCPAQYTNPLWNALKRTKEVVRQRVDDHAATVAAEGSDWNISDILKGVDAEKIYNYKRATKGARTKYRITDCIQEDLT